MRRQKGHRPGLFQWQAQKRLGQLYLLEPVKQAAAKKWLQLGHGLHQRVQHRRLPFVPLAQRRLRRLKI